jgi:hypothetical protein
MVSITKSQFATLLQDSLHTVPQSSEAVNAGAARTSAF